MMPSDPQIDSPQLPSMRRLAVTTVVAILVAAAILVTIVLPAEYGIDPLRTGAALGLTPLAGPVATATQNDDLPGNVSAPAVQQEGPVGHYATAYKIDQTQFVLGPYEYVEYKYRLEQDATMLYSWAADGGVVHDFHGEREGGWVTASESFDKKARREDHGTFTAPFSGIHGWFWENPGGGTVTVRLSSAGFYDSAIELRFDKTRHPRTLMPVTVR